MVESKFGVWSWELHSNNGILNKVPLQLHSSDDPNHQLTDQQKRQLIRLNGNGAPGYEIYPVDIDLVEIRKFICQGHTGCLYIYGDEPNLCGPRREAYVRSYIKYTSIIKGKDPLARFSPAGIPAPLSEVDWFPKYFWETLKSMRPDDYEGFVQEWRFNMQFRVEDSHDPRGIFEGWRARMEKIVSWRREAGAAERPVVITIGPPEVGAKTLQDRLDIEYQMMDYLRKEDSFDSIYWYSLDAADDNPYFLYDFTRDSWTPDGLMFSIFAPRSFTAILGCGLVSIPVFRR